MKQRILLVDDEETFRTSLAEGLGDGRERIIYTATDGIDAVRHLEAHPIDLVLTDLQMPRMTGFELVAYLARQHPRIPVIVTTAFGTADMEHNFRMLGVADYLEKPIDIQAVSHRIDAVLSQPPQANRARAIGRGLVETLAEVSGEGLDGECVVRQGSETGRIFFVEGKVAWVTATTVRETLMTRIVANTELTMRELREVFDECKRTQRNFGETLVDWGLIDRDSLRRFLLDHISLGLAHLAGWQDADVLFVPEKRRYQGQLLFGVSELVHAALVLCPGESALVSLASRLGLHGNSGIPAGSSAPLQQSEGLPVPISDSVESTAEPMSAESNIRSVSATSPNPRGDLPMSEMNSVLETLKVVDGFMGAAAFTAEGDVLAAIGGAGFHINELGALANDVLLKAQKTTDIMGVGRGNQIMVSAPRATVLVRCLNENTDFSANEPGRAHVHMMLILEPESNVGLGKMRLEKAIQQIAPLLR